MRHGVESQGLPEQLPIRLQKRAGISGAGIGDDKPDVEIARSVGEHRQEVGLGKVERDDTVLDTRRPGAFSANRPQQGLSPADQSYMNSRSCDLPRKFLADAGRATCDKCPGAELFFIEYFSHLFTPFSLLRTSSAIHSTR